MRCRFWSSDVKSLQVVHDLQVTCRGARRAPRLGAARSRRRPLPRTIMSIGQPAGPARGACHAPLQAPDPTEPVNIPRFYVSPVRLPSGPDPGGPRRRLWRHRNQPPLLAARVFSRRAFGSPKPRQRARRAVADLLVAGHRHHWQVRLLRDAGRQPRRRRRDVADGPGAAHLQGTAESRGAAGVGAVWRGAVLRRRRDHAGHHRAGRGRRLEHGDDGV